MSMWIHSDIAWYETPNAKNILRKLEYAARTCYRSFDKMDENSAEKLLSGAIKRGHESVLEHAQFTFEVICSRDVLAQWTRHRLASYSVESQRYCNYTKDKFDGFKFIMPEGVTEDMASEIHEAIVEDIEHYENLIAMGAKPEQARSILPNCTKVQFIWSANVREIRHFIALRTSSGAQPDIAKLGHQLIQLLQEAGLGILIEDLI